MHPSGRSLTRDELSHDVDPDFGEGDISTEEDAAFLMRIAKDDSSESAVTFPGSMRKAWSRLIALLDPQQAE